NALLRIDGGMNTNATPGVDFTDPNNNVLYGFEQFSTRTPGYNNAANDYAGTYAETVSTTNLSEGYHYITARAFRHRQGGDPAIYQDFKKVVYVDRFRPVSSIESFDG